MTTDRKKYFIDQLRAHSATIISGAHRAETSSARAAQAIQREARTQADGEGAAWEARVAERQGQRREQAVHEVDALIEFASQGMPRFTPKSAVDLGAMIDVSVESDDGTEERTLFLRPVGAGTELHGPGG